ncbi:hypothetical protein CLOM_g17082, partial [Closterium sp. NIES-68]
LRNIGTRNRDACSVGYATADVELWQKKLLLSRNGRKGDHRSCCARVNAQSTLGLFGAVALWYRFIFPSVSQSAMEKKW